MGIGGRFLGPRSDPRPDPVEVAGEIVRPRMAPEPKKAQPFYEGEDCATLAAQPHHHRER